MSGDRPKDATEGNDVRVSTPSDPPTTATLEDNERQSSPSQATPSHSFPRSRFSEQRRTRAPTATGAAPPATAAGASPPRGRRTSVPAHISAQIAAQAMQGGKRRMTSALEGEASVPVLGRARDDFSVSPQASLTLMPEASAPAAPGLGVKRGSKWQSILGATLNPAVATEFDEQADMSTSSLGQEVSEGPWSVTASRAASPGHFGPPRVPRGSVGGSRGRAKPAADPSLLAGPAAAAANQEGQAPGPSPFRSRLRSNFEPGPLSGITVPEGGYSNEQLQSALRRMSPADAASQLAGRRPSFMATVLQSNPELLNALLAPKLKAHLDGPSKRMGVIGSAVEFIVQVDQDPMRGGKEVEAGDLKLYVRSGPARSKDFKVDVVKIGEGRFSMSWGTHVSGVYVLALTCQNSGVDGSPVEVQVEMPVTTAENCTVRGIRAVHAGAKSTFHVIARDQAGNQRSKGGDDFHVSIKGPGRLAYAIVRDESNGSYSVSFRADTAGNYKAHITFINKVGEKPLLGSPFNFEVMPGPCAPNRVKIAEDPGAAGEPSLLLFERARENAIAAAAVTGMQLALGSPRGYGENEGEFGSFGEQGGLDMHPVIPLDSTAGVPGRFWITGADAFGNALRQGGDRFEAFLIPWTEDTREYVEIRDLTPPASPGQDDIPPEWRTGASPRHRRRSSVTRRSSQHVPLLGQANRAAVPSPRRSTAIAARRSFATNPAQPPVPAHLDVRTPNLRVPRRSRMDDLTLPQTSPRRRSTMMQPPEGPTLLGAFSSAVGARANRRVSLAYSPSRGNRRRSVMMADQQSSRGGHEPEEPEGIRRAIVHLPEHVPRVPVEVANRGDGFSYGVYQLERAGDYALVISTNGNVLSHLGMVHVRASGAVPETSHIVDRSLLPSVVIAGEFHECIVQCCDKFGNPLKKGGDEITVEIKPQQKRRELRRRAQGISKANSLALSRQNTMSLSNLETAGVEFILPQDDGEDSSWGIPTGTMSLKTGSSTVQVKVEDIGGGRYLLRWTATMAGGYDVYVRLGGAVIGGGKFKFRVTACVCDPGKSRGWGPGLRGGIAGAPANFYISIHDKYGNQCEKGVAKIKLTLEGPEAMQGVVQDNDDGTYRLSYWARRAGMYLIRITCEGQFILGTPRKITVEQGSATDRRWFHDGDGFRGATVGELATFSFQSMDVENQKKCLGGDNFRCILEHREGTDQLLQDLAIIQQQMITPETIGCGVHVPDLAELYRDAFGEAPGPAPSTAKLQKQMTHADYSRMFETPDRGRLAELKRNAGAQLRKHPSIEADVVDNCDGSYSCSYTAEVGGEYYLRVLCFKAKAKKGKQRPAASQVRRTEPTALQASGEGESTGEPGETDTSRRGSTAAPPSDQDPQDPALPRRTTTLDPSADANAAGTRPASTAESAGLGVLSPDRRASQVDAVTRRGSVAASDLASAAGGMPSYPSGLEPAAGGASDRDQERVASREGAGPSGRKSHAQSRRTSTIDEHGKGPARKSPAPGSRGEKRASASRGGDRHRRSATGPQSLSAKAPSNPADPSHKVAFAAKMAAAAAEAGGGTEGFDGRASEGFDPALEVVAECADGFQIRRGMIVEENAEGYWVDLTPVDLRGRPPIVSVVPAAIDFDHSFVWGESLGSLKAGVVGQFHVILVDHFDNVVGQSAGDLQAALMLDYDPRVSSALRGGPVIIKPRRRLKRDGSYTFSFESEIAGSYQGILMLNGIEVPELAFTALITPTQIAPLKCISKGDGLTKAHAGTEASFVVELRDLYNNVKPASNEDKISTIILPKGQLSLNSQSGAAKQMGMKASVSDDPSGLVRVSYTMKKKGTYLVVVQAESASLPEPVVIKTAELSVEAGAPVARSCIARGPGLTRAVAGYPTAVHVFIKDAFGNEVSYLDPHSGASLASGNGLSARLVSVQDGRKARDRPDASTLLALATDDRESAVARILARSSSLTHKDEHVGGAGDDEDEPAGSVTIFHETVEDRIADRTLTVPGVYRLMYRARCGGLHELHVTVNHKPIQGSPFRVNVMNEEVPRHEWLGEMGRNTRIIYDPDALHQKDMGSLDFECRLEDLDPPGREEKRKQQGPVEVQLGRLRLKLGDLEKQVAGSDASAGAQGDVPSAPATLAGGNSSNKLSVMVSAEPAKKANKFTKFAAKIAENQRALQNVRSEKEEEELHRKIVQRALKPHPRTKLEEGGQLRQKVTLSNLKKGAILSYHIQSMTQGFGGPDLARVLAQDPGLRAIELQPSKARLPPSEHTDLPLADRGLWIPHLRHKPASVVAGNVPLKMSTVRLIEAEERRNARTEKVLRERISVYTGDGATAGGGEDGTAEAAAELSMVQEEGPGEEEQVRIWKRRDSDFGPSSSSASSEPESESESDGGSDGEDGSSADEAILEQLGVGQTSRLYLRELEARQAQRDQTAPSLSVQLYSLPIDKINPMRPLDERRQRSEAEHKKELSFERQSAKL